MEQTDSLSIKQACKCGEGILDIIGQTKSEISEKTGEIESTYFFKCINGCEKIFLAKGGVEENGWEGAAESWWDKKKVELYTGGVPENKIRGYYPYFIGDLTGNNMGTIAAMTIAIDDDLETKVGKVLTCKPRGGEFFLDLPEVLIQDNVVFSSWEQYKFEKLIKQLRELVLVAIIVGDKGGAFDKEKEILACYASMSDLYRPLARKEIGSLNAKPDGDDDVNAKIIKALNRAAKKLNEKIDDISY